MSKYPLLTFRLPTGSDPKQVRADFANVAKHHGYLTDYHSKTEHGSPGLFIQAINGGEVVTAPFQPEWYEQALAALRPFVESREMWAESLSASIRAAQNRAFEADSDIMKLREWNNSTPLPYPPCQLGVAARRGKAVS